MKRLEGEVPNKGFKTVEYASGTNPDRSLDPTADHVTVALRRHQVPEGQRLHRH